MPSPQTEQLRQLTREWIAADPCAADADELAEVLWQAESGHDGATAELAARMATPLSFGTAGLRGPLRAGQGGMNLAVVRRAAAGVAAYLRETGALGPVIVGYDARHRSAEFAADVAGVFAAQGFDVLLAPGPLPTPITAYATRSLAAAAGIQITASHNPPADNGMKVYLQAGTQLVAPADTAIEKAIAASGRACDIDASGKPQPWPAKIISGYLQRAAGLATGSAKKLRIAATAMHGVGAQTLRDALSQAGFDDVYFVNEQRDPDPDFPTVAFPNPEEPGACDLLLALAESVDADVAIANDPDADRIAIGIKDSDGRWRLLSGDEAGCLLAVRVLNGLDRMVDDDPLVATTIVSSSLLSAIAAAHDVRYDETLTGFKNIVRAGDGAGTGLIYGYEEALGICADPQAVRDKDGISAAVLAADFAATLKSGGRSLRTELDCLARAHGLHLTDQLSVRVSDPAEIADAMARLRAAMPQSLLGKDILLCQDLLPETDAVLLRTKRTKVVVRPSGTEPKLKCYLEYVARVPRGIGDLSDIRAEGRQQLALLRTEIAALLGINET